MHMIPFGVRLSIFMQCRDDKTRVGPNKLEHGNVVDDAGFPDIPCFSALGLEDGGVSNFVAFKLVPPSRETAARCASSGIRSAAARLK